MNKPSLTPVLLLAVALLALPGCGDKTDPDEKKAVEAPSGKGLKYYDMEEGDGKEEVKEGDLVEVRYRGKLKSGLEEFDTNIDNNKPVLRFVVGGGGVIQGFDAGVLGMKPGGKRKLFIPAALGYGSRSKDKIPANSDLIFEVHLVKIEGVESKTLTEGSGPAVKAGDTVLVDYTGTLKSSGKQFDTSVGRKPFQVQVGAGRVIKGWDIGLVGMKVGEVRRLTIPPELGYGDQGSPPNIPGGATLVFEIKLLQIQEDRNPHGP